VMSAGINAATGAVVGNIASGMHGGGQRILVLRECLREDGSTTGEQCLWGSVLTGGIRLGGENDKECQNGNTCYYNPFSKITICDSVLTGTQQEGAEPGRNHFRRVGNVTVSMVAGKNVSSTSEAEWITEIRNSTNAPCFIDLNNSGNFTINNTCNKSDEAEIKSVFFRISSSGTPENVSAVCGATRQNAMLQGVNLQPTMIGNIMGIRADRSGWREAGGTVVSRTTDGNITTLSNGWGNQEDLHRNFTPLTVGAEDGDVLDFTNRARTTATLSGAGVGAGLGALSARKEALDAVQMRLIEATEQYEALTRRFYCFTGTRYLSDYNMPVTIPQLVGF